MKLSSTRILTAVTSLGLALPALAKDAAREADVVVYGASALSRSRAG